MKEIILEKSGVRSWFNGAWVIAFVYSKYNGNFVVKGYYGEVKKYLRENHDHWFANFTLWCEGKYRSIWHFWKDRVYIVAPDRRLTNFNYSDDKKYKWKVRHFKKDINLSFKRLPKRWISKFDRL